MQYKPLGTSGIEASTVMLGSWAIGGWMWGGTEEKDAVRAIHAALDNGITAIDTAPVYGFGFSEELVGKAIKDRRNSVVVATKCGLIWHAARGTHAFDSDKQAFRPSGSIHVYRCLAPETIRYEVEQSLRRLQTGYVDLYQTHWQDPTTPIEETMAELLKLKQEGKIRAIGVSNATPTQMSAYRAAGGLDSDQEKYSMLDRKMESGQLAYCQKNSIAFLAYSPLALGLLTGTISGETVFGEGDLRRNNPRFAPDNLAKVSALLDELRPIAGQYDITLPQLVIAWTLQQPGCTHALVGARSERHARENALAGAVNMSEDDLTAMNKIIATHLPAIT